MKRVKVWDLAVRLSHLLMGALVLGAFLTAEEDDTIPLHTRLGLAMLGVVVFRVVWGFLGTRHARFSDFVKSPRVVLAAARDMVRGKPGVHLGHNPVGAMMVLALLATLLTIAGTGIIIAMGPEWDGALAGVLTKSSAHAVKELHEGAAGLLVVLIGFHVAGVVASSFLEKQNLLAGMVTGYKRAPEAMSSEDGAWPWQRVGGFLAALVLGLGAVAVGWKLLPIGTAEAATPVLSQYQARAQAEDPSFKGFDAERGRALYTEEHPGKNGNVSCVTCHKADARQEGRSPVGKVIEPLAPSANPQRFTDLAKSDKWFDRNCKQVFGRTCTARERGDVVTYLSTL
jgi:cytochrome b